MIVQNGYIFYNTEEIMDKNLEVNDYVKSLTGEEKEWMQFFVDYMRKNHSDLEEVISFKMPTYKLGRGKLRNYIAFSPAKKHFSMHSMDFEYISKMKEKMIKPGKGKGCVNVSYSNIDEQRILIEGIEEIIKRKIVAIYGK